MKIMHKEFIMRKIDVNAIEESFKEYFDAEWLAYIIENGGYSNLQCGYKVAINLTTNQVWSMQNDEYSQDMNVEYFSFPKYIVNYSNELEDEIKSGNYSKNKTLKGYINDSFFHLGHFCIDDCSNEFYLKDELHQLQKIGKKINSNMQSSLRQTIELKKFIDELSEYEYDLYSELSSIIYEHHVREFLDNEDNLDLEHLFDIFRESI
jgi:hypothetical protein